MVFNKHLSDIRAKYFSAGIGDHREQSLSTANLFALLAFVFGVIFIYLNPPMVCPDENAHFLNICRISGGSIFADVQDGAIGSFITQDQADFINNYYGRFQGLGTEKYSFGEAYFLSHLNYTGNQRIFYGSDLSAINPAAYIIQSSGVFIAQNLFNITSPYNLLIWAKLFNLVFFIIMTRIAILKTPVFRNTMFLIALMPMTMYQCSSASYDCAVISGTFLLFAYASKLILSDDDYRVSKEDIFAVCFSCAFIFSAKIAYAPLVLILLAVNRKKFGNLKRYIMCICSVIMTGIVFYVIPTAITNFFTSGISSEAPIVVQQHEYILSHIGLMPGVIIRTARDSLPFWINGFFGILGGLDINFPQPFIYLYLIVLLIYGVTEMCMAGKANLPVRILSFIGVSAFYAGTAMAMYAGWTPLVTGEVGGEYFTGIQGRYFIPVALYVLIIFANPLLLKFKYSDKIIDFQTTVSKYIVIGYLCLSCLVVFTKIWI